MYSPSDWGCCSYVPEALMTVGGAKTRYFLLFLDLNPLRVRSDHFCVLEREGDMPFVQEGAQVGASIL